MQENKKNNATHYIEQYRCIDDESDFEHTEIDKIDYLGLSLYYTKEILNLKTVCIFLITPKQNP